MSNMLDIFLINAETKAAESLVLKLAGPHKLGEIIKCSREEMEELQYVVRITSPQEVKSDMQLIEIDSEKYYLAVVKQGSVNMDDLVELRDKMKGHLKIIRRM